MNWLMPTGVKVAPTGAMRFFVQPRWAQGSHSIDRGLRRRDTASYSEFEVEVQFDEGPVVGVGYVIPQSDSSLMFATCFSDFFQPIRKILFGPGDEFTRRSFAKEMERTRPLYTMATANGLYGDYAAGALIQYTDPNDGVHKTLLVRTVGRKGASSDLGEEEMNLLGELLGTSFLLFDEAISPLDDQRINRNAELAEVRHTAGEAARWLFEHSHEVVEIARIFSG